MDTKWFFIAIVFIVVAGIVAATIAENNEAEQMKACVAAGKDWVRDFGSNYECVG